MTVTPEPSRPEPIEKISVIISKGSLEGIYPGLIMANGARKPRGSRPTCSSPSLASTPSIVNATNTSSWPPSATPVCTCPPWRVASPARPPS